MNAIEIIKDYIDTLQSHDWYYVYSDDHSVYMKGSASSSKLRELQQQIDVDYQIWNTIAPEDCHGKY